ncbi:hypothetical protein EAJ17_06360 [Akkermansia sp. aa_0143]|jgi:hypothetical protein|nr:hypothetical protein F2A23_11975 [Akkermansia sp. BIOML-A63]KAA3190723.1 hypothetical protein F2A21_12620 [Akkermansia sp. BIOML-A54]KAA3242972.1 hypothetical protein F1971_02745 [Akkermansia sp. BIOML-A40]MBD9270371.1 hypothetical protein [Akkermansia sp.]RYT98260.1 hypothetical protein EAJ17_06360 [Akkermansia sp. aa_0143]
MKKRPSKATAGSGQIPALAHYSLQPFGRGKQGLVNLSTPPDEFTFPEAQGKEQGACGESSRMNMDECLAVRRHAGKSLPGRQASDAVRLLYPGRTTRKPIPPCFGENAVPPASSPSVQAPKAVFLAVHRSMTPR